MPKSICDANCAECPSKDSCRGCVETNGCPYGKQCFAAQYILTRGADAWQTFKNEIIDQTNTLGIAGMEKVTELFPLVGSFVNLEYPLPGGEKVKFLRDDEIYLGAQVKNLSDESGKTCFGIIARESFLLVCQYGENCAEPEIVVYTKR